MGDTWSFLILHKGEALREMWRKLEGVDLERLGIEQVTNIGDRAYLRHQESKARLGIVAESEVDVVRLAEQSTTEIEYTSRDGEKKGVEAGYRVGVQTAKNKLILFLNHLPTSLRASRN